MQVPACQALYKPAVYFPWSLSFCGACSAAGVNFSGEMLEALTAGLADGVKWCSCTAAHVLITVVQTSARGGGSSLLTA